MAARLSPEEISEGLERLPGWRQEGAALVRDVELAGFSTAISVVDRVAELAEAANHHPDILIHGYRHVRLSLSTHSAGGVTRADLGLAEAIEELLDA